MLHGWKRVPVFENRRAILDFLDCKLAEGIKAGRLTRYVTTLTKFSGYLNKPFRAATQKDMVDAVSLLEREKTADVTTVTEKICIKVFFRWLKGDEGGYLPEIA
jgi:site-specific recombinase XerD